MSKRLSKRPSEGLPDQAEQAPESQPPSASTADNAPPVDGKNPAAVELGRLGGKKGGKARAAALTPEQRREIAKKAAQARWKNR